MADVERRTDLLPPPPLAAPRRLHPLTPALDLFDRNLLAPGVIAFGSGGVRILAAVLAVMGAFRTLAWTRTSWVLDERVLRVSSGVLARNEQLVPCDRIQQVNLVQKLRHRLFGVASLRVEVAGGGRGSGVALDVLGLEEATDLRTVLLAAKAEATLAPSAPGLPAGGVPGSDDDAPTADAAPRWVPTAWPVVRVSNRQLVIAGLTGSELFVLFAFAASMTQLLGDAPAGLRRAVEGVDVGPGGPLVTAALVVAFLVVWLGSAVATSVLRDAGYALDLVGDELHLARGLLDRKEAVLPLARVQSVQVIATPLRRPLGYVSLRVQSASAGTEQEDRRVSVPILPVAQLPGVLDLLLPGSAALPPLAPSPPVARRRAVVRAVWPVALVAAVVACLTAPLGLLALLLVVPAAGFGLLSYRGLGHALGPHHVVARSGAVVRRTVIVPLERGQSTRVRASFLQRRLGLATLLVDVAGPGRRPAVVDVSAARAEELGRSVVAAVGGR